MIGFNEVSQLVAIEAFDFAQVPFFVFFILGVFDFMWAFVPLPFLVPFEAITTINLKGI